MPVVRLSSKSQLVLPAAIRKRLAIKLGDLRRVIEKNDTSETPQGSIMLCRCVRRLCFEYLVGIRDRTQKIG